MDCLAQDVPQSVVLWKSLSFYQRVYGLAPQSNTGFEN
jgi:hypothetical protein